MVSVSPSTRHRAVTVTGLAAVALYIGLVLWGMGQGSYNTWSALIIGPVLLAGIVPLLRRQAEREADPRLFRLLLAAFGLKMLGSLARYWVAYGLYEGATDAQGYHEAGMRIAGELIQSPPARFRIELQSRHAPVDCHPRQAACALTLHSATSPLISPAAGPTTVKRLFVPCGPQVSTGI